MPSSTHSSSSTRAGQPWLLVTLSLAASILIVLPSLPGRMNADALDMYGEGLGAPFHDWHPVIIPWLWRQLGASPQLIALETILVAFCTVYAVVAVLRANGAAPLRALIAAAAFALFPPVFGYLTAVSKDTWLAAILVAMFALASTSKGEVAASIRGLFAGLAPFIRPETILLAPVWVWSEYALAPRKGVRFTVALGACAFAALALTWLVNEVVKPDRRQPESAIFLFDLAGISVRTGELLLTPASFPAQDLDVLRRHYWPATIAPIAWDKPHSEMIRFVRGDDLAEVRRRWIGAILAHPLAYLETRAGVIAPYLRGHWGFHPRIDANDEIHLFWPRLHEFVNAYLWAAPPVLFARWITLLGVPLLLVLIWRLKLGQGRDEWTHYLILAIIYQLILLPLINGADYRYGYASTVLFFLILMLAARELCLRGRGAPRRVWKSK